MNRPRQMCNNDDEGQKALSDQGKHALIVTQ
jgi:hypothetical protein